MSDLIRINQPPVPDDFAATLRRLRVEDSDRLNSLLLDARRGGWNYRALADALGVTPKAVRIRVARAQPVAGLPPVPPVPRKPTPMQKVRQRPELEPGLIDELREINAVARTVNGGTAPEDPARRVSEQFSAQLAGLVEQGVTVYYLAKVLGVSHTAIFMRLARHGYRKPFPSLVGTHGETYKNRKNGDGRTRAAECGYGHPMSGDNLYVSPSGARGCRECGRRRARDRCQRKKAAAVPLPSVPAPPAPPSHIELEPELVNQLREMQAVARTVHGGMEPGHPARRISEQLSATLAGLVEQGMADAYLASLLGVTPPTVALRLARHGYRKPRPSLVGTSGGTYKNRKSGGENRAEECGWGHPMSGDNLHVTPRGKRHCRACGRRRWRDDNQRKKAAAT